jgi:hypothetical protein
MATTKTAKMKKTKTTTIGMPFAQRKARFSTAKAAEVKNSFSL